MSLIRDVNAIGVRKISPRDALLAEKAKAPEERAPTNRPDRPSAFSNDQSFAHLEERIAALEEERAKNAETIAALIARVDVIEAAKPKAGGGRRKKPSADAASEDDAA